MNHLLLELIRPIPSDAAMASLEHLSRRSEWPRFCTLLHWAGLAPLAYTRLRAYPGLVPSDVMKWLHAQYYETIGRGLYLIGELDRVVERFAVAGLECLIFKGPALAYFTRGLERIFGDLDLLIKRADLRGADQLLRAIGYEPVVAEHPYHCRYVRTNGAMPAVVEIHFGLQGQDQFFSPDVRAIWDRSAAANVFGVTCRVPDLTDHFLLLMLQLPHHHWPLRVIGDIGQMVWRWREDIDWSGLTTRAREWRMRALAGSTLYVVGSVLRLTFPLGMWNFLMPESYFRRVQWQIIKAAVAERLAGRGEGISRLARYVIADRFQDVRPFLARRVYAASGSKNRRDVGDGLRRLAAGVSTLPAFGVILLKSAPRIDLTDSGIVFRAGST